MVEICAECLISRLKILGAMTISLVAMATATLILFHDVVFELNEAGISFYIFFLVLLLTVSVHLSVFREIRRKDVR